MKMKQIPEDFVVTEIIPDSFSKYVSRDPSKYIWFTLKKTNWDLFRALKAVSRQLNVSVKRFGYAGTKDKNAVTFQTISVSGISLERLKMVKVKDIELSDFRHATRDIGIGDLEGNHFRITLRDLTKMDERRIRGAAVRIKRKGIINFFGFQRFGTNRGITHMVGRYIVRNDLESAVWTYLTHVSKAESKRKTDARKRLGQIKNIDQALKDFQGIEPEIIILNRLKKYPDDYAGALRMLQSGMLKMFVHAYQSFLWNEIAKKIKSGQNARVPLIGYGTDIENYPRIEKIIRHVLDSEDIQPGDFRISSLPEISCKGDDRDLIIFPKNFDYRFEKDDLNRGRIKAILEFTLPKGSYATEVIRQIF
jgi:tRNA pseudouridine13 synthase